MPWVWHAYHDKLMCWIESVEARIRTIQEMKPQSEQADRIRWLKPVAASLPKEFQVACAACDKACAACDKAKAAYNKAVAAYVKAKAARDSLVAACNKAWVACDDLCEKHRDMIEELHVRECPDCTWNGKELVFRKP